MNEILKRIRDELKLSSDEAVKNTAQRFFKEKITVYGVKSAAVVKIGKEYFKQIKGKSKAEIFKMCDLLWQSSFMEESFIACNWSHYVREKYEPADFKTFERWLGEYVDNWASCDTLCNHTVGDFVKMYPEFVKRLKSWAVSKNRWLRRAAAVSLIIPAKEGMFLSEIFEIADILLEDGDDLVQKGYGWMLKAASHAHCKEVFDYVYSKKAIMPRTALRYAIEKMPADLRKKAMAK